MVHHRYIVCAPVLLHVQRVPLLLEEGKKLGICVVPSKIVFFFLEKKKEELLKTTTLKAVVVQTSASGLPFLLLRDLRR